MGGIFWKSQAQLQTEELKNQTELLQRKIDNQEKMLKIIILNTKALITTLSSHIDDKNIIKDINKLLDEQEKILNENLSEEKFF